MNLTDWLGDHGWALWLSLALLLAVAEVVSLDLVLIMLAVGALAAAGTAAVAPDLWVLQILVGAGVSGFTALGVLGEAARPLTGSTRRLRMPSGSAGACAGLSLSAAPMKLHANPD